MSKGRGLIFGLGSKSNSGSDKSNQDSALGQSMTGSRGRLLSSVSNLSLGDSDKSPSASKSEELKPMTLNSGRGRAFFLMKSSTTSGFTTAESVTTTTTSTTTTTTTPTGEQPSSSSGKSEVAPESSVEIAYHKPATTQGTAGTEVRMACNYLRLNLYADKGVYLYNVTYTPAVDRIGTRIKLLNKHRDKLGTRTFDGHHLCMPTLLKDDLVLMSHDDMEDKDIQIHISFKRKESEKQCLHLYNVLFERVMSSLSYVRFANKQFDPTEAKILPQAKLEIWPGYVTAVDYYDGGLMLCCDVSHRVLFQKTVLEMLREISLQKTDHFQDAVKKSLLGSVVITRYNNRTYRIDNVCFDLNPQSKFQTKNGEITYIDYYKSTYNIDIKDFRQPLLLSIKKCPKYLENKSEDIVFCLVPELCYLSGLRDDMRNDFKLMREMASFTKVTPNQRVMALKKFYKNVNESADATKILADWGLSLAPTIVETSGRILKEEVIEMAKGKYRVGPQADFTRHVVSNELLEVKHVNEWILVHCKSDTRIANSFCDFYNQCSRALGIEVKRPKFVVLDMDRTAAYANALRANINSRTELVVCICPTSRDDRYNAIKRICCSEMPIPSQVINARTLANDQKNRSIVQKIALQINCKLGGTLWSVKIPFSGVMICGIDAYHDGADLKKDKSVAGFVASLNQVYTKWYSKAIMQEKREEVVKGLCAALTSALLAYEQHNQAIPEKVIIFR